ncbi:unnamed protein product, partial [Ectocarpus sp. 12 AP-2014]
RGGPGRGSQEVPESDNPQCSPHPAFWIMLHKCLSGVRREQDRHTDTAGSGGQNSLSADNGA